MTWLDKPLLVVDCETTGTDPETARIITCCVGYSSGVGDWRPSLWSVNPGVPIPPEASKVHGISDADVAGWTPAVEGLGTLWQRMDCAYDTPVVLHNASFDLTLLDREFRRHYDKPLPPLIVIDTLVLFRRFDLSTGSRSLEQLANRHGIVFPAHNAEADALATLKLLHILASINDLLPYVAPDDLHRMQAQWYAAQQSAAHYRRLGNGNSSTPLDTDWPVKPWPADVELPY